MFENIDNRVLFLSGSSSEIKAVQLYVIEEGKEEPYLFLGRKLHREILASGLEYLGINFTNRRLAGRAEGPKWRSRGVYDCPGMSHIKITENGILYTLFGESIDYFGKGPSKHHLDDLIPHLNKIRVQIKSDESSLRFRF